MKDLLCALDSTGSTGQAPDHIPAWRKRLLCSSLDSCSGCGGCETLQMGVEGSSGIQTAWGTTLCRATDVFRQKQEEAGGD